MKKNFRNLSATEFFSEGLTAVSYETPHEYDGQEEEGGLGHDCDFHITLYKHEEVVLWMMLCPVSRSAVKLKTKYTSGQQDCGPVEEKVLRFAESWAKDLGYKQIIIHACLASEAFYKRLGYHCTGEKFTIASQEHCKMVKNL
jgi:hypothetical protein